MAKRSKASNSGTSARNILAISELERQALERRTAAQKFSDFVTQQAGRSWFILLHALCFALWIAWNSGWYRRRIRPFSVFGPEHGSVSGSDLRGDAHSDEPEPVESPRR